MFATPVCHGEKEAKLKGEALDLLVDLCSSPGVIWLMTNDGQQKKSTGVQEEFPPLGGCAHSVDTLSLGECLCD